jgi:hypothetical protein
MREYAPPSVRAKRKTAVGSRDWRTNSANAALSMRAASTAGRSLSATTINGLPAESCSHGTPGTSRSSGSESAAAQRSRGNSPSH